MSLRVFFVAIGFLIFAFTCEFLPAQSVAYLPSVGEKYDYGIEYRINETQKENWRASTSARVRCRLRFVVTESSNAGFSAKFMTIPFWARKPATSKELLERHYERNKEEYKNPPPSPFDRSSSLFPQANQQRLQESRERMAAIRKEDRRRAIVRVERYPGLYRFCEGTVQVDARGKVTITSGRGELPFATGHIAKLLFLKLPENGDTTSGFSSRELNRLYLTTVDGKPEDALKTEILELSLISPRKASAKGMVAFDREIETSGGATAGNKIAIFGNGFWEFSDHLKMPYAGSVDYQIKGLTFLGASDEFTARIGFHFLHGVRASLFDNDLLPTLDALEKHNMPQMDSKQLSNLKQTLDTVAKLPETRIISQVMRLPYDDLLYMAPPPLDSGIQETVGKLTAALRSTRGAIHSHRLDDLVERWDKLRELATIVPRKWSDESGSFSIEAKLVNLDGDNVILKRTDNNQTIKVPLTRLGKDDADFAKSYGIPVKDAK